MSENATPESNLLPVTNDANPQIEAFAVQLAELISHRIMYRPFKSVSLKELYEAYMRLQGELRCKSSSTMQRLYKNYLAHWEARQVADLSRIEIEELFAQLANEIGETTANRAIELLRTMFNHGVRLNLIDCPSPLTNFKTFKLKPRERFFEQNELIRLFAAFDALRYETTRDFLYMCLYTGARRSNVAAMKWEEVSFEHQFWRLPETKNGTSQTIPLPPQAVQILQRRYSCRDSQWVFPSKRSHTGHLTKPEAAWRVATQRAGLTNARIHDLRRTLGSWQALTGANVLVIGQTLNHKDLKSTQIYARLNVDAVRKAMNTAVDAMVGQKRRKKSVVKLTAEHLKECSGDAAKTDKRGYSRSRYGLGVDERGCVVSLPEEVAVIKDILRMRAEGISLGEIANMLNKERRFRRGKPWNKSHIDWLCGGKLKYLERLGDDSTTGGE